MPEQCRCGQAKFKGHKCNAVKCHTCWDCGFFYGYLESDIHTCCDTVEGEYIEYEATTCPKCKITNPLYNYHKGDKYDAK